MLFNPKRPFIICVDGTIECGKKLVADIGRDTLFPGNEDFYARMTSDDETAVRDIPPSLQHKKPEKPLRNVHGRENYAEYASGNYKGKDLTVSFVNIAYGNGMRTHVAKRPKTEGIVFAHNGPSIRQNADIAIWMERDTSWLDLVCPEADDSHMTLDSPHFTDDLPAQFQHAVQNSCAQWYVTLILLSTIQPSPRAKPSPYPARYEFPADIPAGQSAQTGCVPYRVRYRPSSLCARKHRSITPAPPSKHMPTRFRHPASLRIPSICPAHPFQRMMAVSNSPDCAMMKRPEYQTR